MWEQCQSWLAARHAEAVSVTATWGDWSSRVEESRGMVRVELAGAGPAARRNADTAIALTYHYPVAPRR